MAPGTTNALCCTSAKKASSPFSRESGSAIELSSDLTLEPKESDQAVELDLQDKESPLRSKFKRVDERGWRLACELWWFWGLHRGTGRCCTRMGASTIGVDINIPGVGIHWRVARSKRGVITTDDKTINGYKVTFANGRARRAAGSSPTRCAPVGPRRDGRAPARDGGEGAAVRAACEARLSVALRTALRTVRERVLVDALPLLSLVQSEPLQLQL